MPLASSASPSCSASARSEPSALPMTAYPPGQAAAAGRSLAVPGALLNRAVPGTARADPDADADDGRREQRDHPQRVSLLLLRRLDLFGAPPGKPTRRLLLDRSRPGVQLAPQELAEHGP